MKEKFSFTGYRSASVKFIVQSSVRIVAMQVIAAFLLFANNYIIIKAGGDQIYGSYVSLMAWVSLFSVIIVFGFDDYFVAALPKIYFNKETKAGVLSILSYSFTIVFVIFSLLIIILTILIYTHFFESVILQNQLYFFVLLTEVSLLTILTAFFRGINSVVTGQVIDKLVRPGLMILLVASVFLSSKQLTLKTILLIQITVLLAAVLFMCIQLKKTFPSFHRPAVVFDKSLKTNTVFLLISILNLLSARLDILFLTKTALPAQVGYYNLGVRMADIIGFPLAAMNLVVPSFLSKENTGNSVNIKKLINNTSLMAFAATLIIYLPAVLLGKYILPLFGKNFIEGYWPMVILGSAHLISSLSHQMNSYLMISGNQKYSLICLIINCLAVFTFCWLLIPRFGLTGAAFSIVLASIIYLIASVFCYRRAVLHLA